MGTLIYDATIFRLDPEPAEDKFQLRRFENKLEGVGWANQVDKCCEKQNSARSQISTSPVPALDGVVVNAHTMEERIQPAFQFRYIR
jgi:hypothetical protein